MKYISQIIVGVAFLITIVACSNVESKLQDYVNEENVNLPIEYGGELVLEKCEFDKQNVVYKYKLPEVAITPEEVEELKASFLNEETLADAISMRGTRSSVRISFVIDSFSDGEKLTPDVCSPSRSVVSKNSICIF